MSEKITVTYYVSDEGWIYTDSFGLVQLEGRRDASVGVEEIDGVKTLVIPQQVDGMDVYNLAFRGFEEGFEALYVPDGVGIIFPYAFAGCAALKTVRVPEDIYDIADTAFLFTAVPEARIRELRAMGQCKKEAAEQTESSFREASGAFSSGTRNGPGNDIPF